MELTVDDLKDPPCPECGCMMWIKRIEPVRPGHDERTFECPRCLYSESSGSGVRLGLSNCWASRNLANFGFFVLRHISPNAPIRLARSLAA